MRDRFNCAPCLVLDQFAKAHWSVWDVPEVRAVHAYHVGCTWRVCAFELAIIAGEFLPPRRRRPSHVTMILTPRGRC
jgi:hypothetical protein